VKAVAVIPARLASTRLPRKVLADLRGRPMLWHVWRRASSARQVEAVFIATDSDEVMLRAREWGARVLRTLAECPSGTDRIAAALDQVPGEFILNVQGDEPLLDPAVLDRLVGEWERTNAPVVTPVYRLTSITDVQNPSVVKAVRAADGRALYFSRSPIPHVRDNPVEAWHASTSYWGHLGIYGYRREALAAFPGLPCGPLERAEKLEQLRFLENGIGVLTVEVGAAPAAVDTPEDLERVRGLMANVEEIRSLQAIPEGTA
jgi:3-deoxy-manno-octulosonate cytidylyltransferase (CMP-KDO synthetase)